MKRFAILVLLLVASLASAQIMLTVDTNVVVPITKVPLVDDDDGVTIKDAVVYNETGLALAWNFVTKAGAVTRTAVTPTQTAGNYDWADLDGGMYSIEIPASGGASINNDTEGFGWFTGVATDIAPWSGPIIMFAKANVVNALVDSSDLLDINVSQISEDSTAADNAELMFDGTGYGGGTTKLDVNVVAISGDSTSADNLESYTDGTSYMAVNAAQVGGASPTTADDVAAKILTTPANLLTTNASGQVTVGAIANDAITAASINTGALTADAFAADAIVAATLATGAITADAIADDAIDAGAIAADAITNSELAATAATEIATAVGAHAIGDSTLTIDQAMQIMTAFMAGKVTGGGTTTLTFRNYADSLNRLVLTVDEDGNRSASVFTANP